MLRSGTTSSRSGIIGYTGFDATKKTSEWSDIYSQRSPLFGVGGLTYQCDDKNTECVLLTLCAEEG